MIGPSHYTVEINHHNLRDLLQRFKSARVKPKRYLNEDSGAARLFCYLAVRRQRSSI